MIEVKNNFSTGLDLDTSYHDVPRSSYVDALNFTRNAIEGSNDRVLTNIVGNQKVNYTYPSAGTVIGAYPYPRNNTVYFCRYSPTGYNGVYEFNRTTRVITKLFESLIDSATDILNFTSDGKINNINVYPSEDGDLLFFLDSLGRPTEMNITRFKAGEYTPVTRDIIDVIKVPPLVPISCIYGNDTTRRTNSCVNKFFRFKYRYVYDDNPKSVCSPISAVPIPLNILDNTYTNVITNNNVIYLNVGSGAKNVKSVEILVSFVNKTNDWSPFASVDIVDKAKQGIADDSSFTYSFYNDSTYPFIDINESLLLYDYVPDYARVQGLANGNVLIYGNITEGLNRTITPNVVNTINTVAAGSGGSVGNLTGWLFDNLSHTLEQTNEWAFSGIPAVGTVVNLTVQRKSDGTQILGATYVTVAGDSSDSVAAGFAAGIVATDITADHSPNVARFHIFKATYEPITGIGIYSQITIIPPSASLNPNVIPTWLWSTQRQIAIAYFNSQGKTNGILYNAKVVFPAYAENGSHLPLIPYINTKIYHLPPDWAATFQFYFTKEATTPFFWATTDVNTTETDYLYFDVTNLSLNQKKSPDTVQVVSYSFQDGDRFRLIRRMSDNTVFADTYDAAVIGLVSEPKINGVVQTGLDFIKIKKVAPFSTVDYTSKVFIIELYRVGQQPPNDKNQAFYELGREYPIILDSVGVRVHGGEIQNQDTVGNVPAEFNFYQGDTYFRQRSVFLSENGSATFYMQDKNIVDFYISAVSSIDGRASAIDESQKPATFGAFIRFGQAYQPNTNINGLNRFYENDTFDLDLTYGKLQRIYIRERFIRSFQQFKVGRIPVFHQIHKDTGGNNISVVTDQLLNPVQYDIGDFGIGDQPESLASHDYADWFSTNIKGTICRASDDGIDNISQLYKVDSWATENIPLRTGSSKIYGAFDQRTDRYILALEVSGDSPAQTIVFSQDDKSFDGFISLFPEMMCDLGTLLISFKDGDLYTHDSTIYNRFFGVDYPSYYVPAFNEFPLQRKSFEAVETIGSDVFSCPEITTSLMSYGTTPQQSELLESDFDLLEGGYCASFLRDSNSIGSLINGSQLKGFYILIKIQKDNASNLIYLALVKVYFINSQLNTQ